VELIYVNLVGATTQLQPTPRLYNLRKPQGEVKVIKLPLKLSSQQPVVV